MSSTSHGRIYVATQVGWITAAWITVCLGSVVLHAQTKPQTEVTPQQEFPELTVPPDADVATLEAIIARAKSATPVNFEQYRSIQQAIRDASKQLMELLSDQESSARYQQAQLDRITASVSLLSNASSEAREKTYEQVHSFLKSKQQLTIRDLQTGFLAAQMFEYQPNKKPARDTYQLMDDLLADDPREEMKSFRLILQAAIRRLDLLGQSLELEARDLDGRLVNMEQYAGKFVLLNFFDSGIDSCRRELQLLQRQYEKYHSQGLEIVGVGLNSSAEELRRFVTANGIEWPIIHDQNSDPLQRLRYEFGISKFPSTFLLNKEATVVSLEAVGAELNRLMQMLFEAPTRATPLPEISTSEKADSGDSK